jgi:hypothetical protein
VKESTGLEKEVGDSSCFIDLAWNLRRNGPTGFAYSDCRGVTESALCRKAESCDSDRFNGGCSRQPGNTRVRVIVTPAVKP